MKRERQVAGEADAAVGGRDVLRTELLDLGGERRLETARAGREIPFSHESERLGDDEPHDDEQ